MDWMAWTWPTAAFLLGHRGDVESLYDSLQSNSPKCRARGYLGDWKRGAPR